MTPNLEQEPKLTARGEWSHEVRGASDKSDSLDRIKEKARIAFTANLSSFFAASDITAPWVLFQVSSSVASLLSLSLSTSNGLEKGPFFFSHLGIQKKSSTRKQSFKQDVQ